MRNREEFYRAMLDFEADLDRMMNWSMAGLFAVMLAPLLVSLLVPVHVQIILTAGAITILLLYGFATRKIHKRVARKHEMLCPQCHTILALKHIGFTGACRKCWARVFMEAGEN